MKNEDVILLGRKAKNETEDFINRHFGNHTKGWPKIRNIVEQYREKQHGKLQAN